MRGPRLSFSEEFREHWDKENMDPCTREYSPRIRRQQIIDALRDITEQAVREQRAGAGEERRKESVARSRVIGTDAWLDDLLRKRSL